GKRLGGFALEDLSLQVRSGEYFVLLGPSGVGKTVLLETIAGLIRPDSGRILWDGEDITASPPERRRFAVVYQDYDLVPHMDVERNIGYGLAAAGAGRTETAARVRETARLLGIEPLLGRRIGALSGGEQQRVALARALVIRPRLLLLDEPLCALDTSRRAQLRAELKRIQRGSGAAFLHVTHDQEEAMALGQRIGVMLGRRIRVTGTPAEIFHRPSDPETARFLDMRNVLDARCRREGLCLCSGVEVHAAGAGPGTEHIWIRPEEILVSARPFDSSARNQFRCRVVDWSPRGALLELRLAAGELELAALITFASFERLDLAPGREVFATFKSSAVYCF
ncbi:MAG: ATP-binding cassette domain-containing protein, partial [Elusimicrobia bacterium]|nr:ATP-binding cassette domain-containing protein [Elusimicrobiota bacterium]